MEPIVDPRRGDVDDDASSTKSRSLFALTGTLLAEISFSKVLLPGYFWSVYPRCSWVRRRF